MLKKEFKRKDVERMRNLIKGQVNKSSELQVGYMPKKEDHKEGDIWEENGKQWTIKNGIKQTATKLDTIKKEAILPIFCPSCNNIMKKQYDPKMYKIHKMCFDCVIDMEAKLKNEGKFEEYERNIVAQNAESYIKDLEQYLLEAINTSNNQYVSERGEVERWKGGLNKEKFFKHIETDIAEFKEKIQNYKNNIQDDKT
jgi:hypothetical protein